MTTTDRVVLNICLAASGISLGGVVVLFSWAFHVNDILRNMADILTALVK